MKKGLYLKMAVGNLKKNYRFFVPHILTGAGLFASFYIILTLAMDQGIGSMWAGAYVSAYMGIGSVIVNLLTQILLFYTNSFLMKQRKRELGLYSVLGMEKRHIGRVLFHENMIGAGCSILLGAFAGTVLYKFCSLLLCRILNTEVVFGFRQINYKVLAACTVVFASLYLLIYFVNRISIAKMKPVELLQSSQSGEKEPRVKWPLLVIGTACIAGGYMISVFTVNPLTAVELFFVAVILVIIGTYFLFTAGSIFVLKCLKRNRSFYYEKHRMPAVSGLIYRMKRNAVGLASIAILSTCVLVMLSTTVSLYVAVEDSIRMNFPQDLYLRAGYQIADEDGKGGDAVKLENEVMQQIALEAIEKSGLSVSEVTTESFLETEVVLCGGAAEFREPDRTGRKERAVYVLFITQECYEDRYGGTVELKEDEIAVVNVVYSKRKSEDIRDSLTIAGTTYKVAEKLPTMPIECRVSDSQNSFGIVLPSQEALDRIYEAQLEGYGIYAAGMTERVAVSFEDVDRAEALSDTLKSNMMDGIMAHARAESGWEDEEAIAISWTFSSIWSESEFLYGMYGSFLFLGMLLGVVFMFATVLIIYYKQLSEGYEDRKRFQIMEKVGMSQAEVRRTIRNQVLLVFFLPLLTAAVHVLFASPILIRILQVLLLPDKAFYYVSAAVSFGVFAVVYILIYIVTARTYYKIVH